MTDENFAAVREVRAAAEQLRLACIAIAPTHSLLHVAYDQTIPKYLARSQKSLLHALNKIA
jgi:hypothetical protein